MKMAFVTVVLGSAALSASLATAASAARQDTLDTDTLNTIKSRFSELIQLANRHDLKALSPMFWQSPA